MERWINQTRTMGLEVIFRSLFKEELLFLSSCQIYQNLSFLHVCVCICIYIYIYSHPQTDCFVLSELFSVARHVGRLKLGSKPVQLYVRLSIRLLGQQAYHVGKGNYKVLCREQQQQRPFVYIFIPYRLPECSILSKSFALR